MAGLESGRVGGVQTQEGSTRTHDLGRRNGTVTGVGHGETLLADQIFVLQTQALENLRLGARGAQVLVVLVADLLK